MKRLLHRLKSSAYLWILLLIVHTPFLHAQCWTLVWADEFDRLALDRSKWDMRIGNDWDLLHYNTGRTENVRVNNGVLQLIAHQEDYMGFDYTAALLHTEHLAAWRYGRIEARMKLPGTQGFVPAFWLLPADNRYGWWPQSGEIDIMEHPTHQPHTIYGTAHTAAYNLFDGGQGPQGGTLNLFDFEDSYHVYAIEWNDEQIDFYVDDIKYYTFPNYHSGYTTWPFDQPFFIRLGLGVGGGWVGPPDQTTVFPVIMGIDYVRVYQQLENIVISGADYVLSHSQNVVYSVPDIRDAVYTWNVTGSAAIASGQSTRQISVHWGDLSGSVNAVVTTDCDSQTVTYPVEVSPNILANPGFEKGVKYWNKNLGYPASAVCNLTTTDVHDGKYALCVNAKTLGPSPWDIQISQRELILEEGKSYEGRFWAKAEGSNREISAAIVNSDDFTLYHVNTFTLTNNWHQFQFQFTASAHARTALNIDLGFQTGIYYFDDFVLTTPGPPSSNHLHNGEFSLGETGWTSHAGWPAQATGSVQNGEYVVSIHRGGNYIWDVYLGQSGLLIENGRSYHVSFEAYASSSRQISALVGKNSDPWTVYSGSQVFSITTTKQRYAYSFTMNQQTDSEARLGFDIGQSDVDVVFDNVTLMPSTESRDDVERRRSR